MTDLPTYPLTANGVEMAIADLPGASEDIAECLEGLGIRGVLDNACGCPLAVYFQRVLSGASYIQVDGTDMFIRGTDIDELGIAWPYEGHPDLPSGMTAFVEDFDQGIYPELIEEVKTYVG